MTVDKRTVDEMTIDANIEAEMTAKDMDVNEMLQEIFSFLQYKMTKDEMTIDVMTVDEIIADEMTVDEIIVDEMTVDEMTADVMTVNEGM